ncbi:MAG: hypothetical protein A2878_02225 [Candidatus Moranbacteria bacterium RIFCSPHIGHO2_01_FULL_54_31]|nr:MAG: hypothetical protein A2878_02225 [Candidatus Moranbacteria bacterium RIFCSPHIGHO2_01_FULL_54_31]
MCYNEGEHNESPPLMQTRNRRYRLICPAVRSLVFAALSLLMFGGAAFAEAQTALPQEALVDLVKPSVVRIAEHVSGTAKIPAIKVDIRRRLVAVVPDKYTEVPVDEYLVGSGFIIHPDGYIATNAHVVSQETVKQMLASESALSALYENALFLSEVEMQEFLQDERENSFSKHVLRYVIEHSVFDLRSEVSVLRPDSVQKNMPDLIAEGFPATTLSVNDNFLEDEKDVALLKIEETRLPALALGNGEAIATGTRAFIFGFPATAELNRNNSLQATFTQGVVSAIKQSADRQFKIFQTDAKVSEGSSGGPFFDERGRVVGMVTFQTDELNRSQGDNFAFALPIELIKAAALEADVPIAEGSYGLSFKQGFQEYSSKHCSKAVSVFQTAREESNPVFVPEDALAAYLEQCDAWQAAGISFDTPLDEFRGTVLSLGHPLIYLIGIAALLFAIFCGALFWILRQVRHEEHEIESLEARLYADEARIKKYDSMPTGRPAASQDTQKKKKIV